MTTQTLTALDSRELLQKAEELRADAIRLGEEWVVLNQRYKDLKELMPHFLATIQRPYLDMGDTVSMARIYALDSKFYLEKLKEMNEAGAKSELKEVHYKAAMKSLESITAISYVRNNELKLSR